VPRGGLAWAAQQRPQRRPTFKITFTLSNIAHAPTQSRLMVVVGLRWTWSDCVECIAHWPVFITEPLRPHATWPQLNPVAESVAWQPRLSPSVSAASCVHLIMIVSRSAIINDGGGTRFGCQANGFGRRLARLPKAPSFTACPPALERDKRVRDRPSRLSRWFDFKS